jgi:prepilin signal peptidase PulO-like enzyme (type II secretory pathway)
MKTQVGPAIFTLALFLLFLLVALQRFLNKAVCGAIVRDYRFVSSQRFEIEILEDIALI